MWCSPYLRTRTLMCTMTESTLHILQGVVWVLGPGQKLRTAECYLGQCRTGFLNGQNSATVVSHLTALTGKQSRQITANNVPVVFLYTQKKKGTCEFKNVLLTRHRIYFEWICTSTFPIKMNGGTDRAMSVDSYSSIPQKLRCLIQKYLLRLIPTQSTGYHSWMTW